MGDAPMEREYEKDFARADHAAALAALSWMERNHATTPDSDAGILLERVAVLTTY